jgi:hypothetical protein
VCDFLLRETRSSCNHLGAQRPLCDRRAPFLGRADGILPDDDDNDNGGCCASVFRRTSTSLGGTPVPESSRYQPVTINLTRDQYTRLQRQAVERTTSVSQLLRELLARLDIEREKRHDHAR